MDTSAEGADVLVRDLVGDLPELALSNIAQQYPGHLFANLMREDQSRPGPDAAPRSPSRGRCEER